VYIADAGNARIRKVSPSGVISTYAGTGVGGKSGDGGPAVQAKLYGPTGIAVDATGNVYFSEFKNQDIRKIDDKGVITTATPDGDKIIFGEAVDSEAEASRRAGRKGAAQDAMRLYARLAEYFPTSPLAAEAAYRSADIRWQIEAVDAATRPSYKQSDPSMKYQIDDQFMKKVVKKFPGTKWADLAAYRLLDNKTCGEWAAEAKCPELEATLYMKYADDHPQSPKTPEALYKAAWRYSALIVIYKSNNDGKKAADSTARATATAKRVMSQFTDNNDWATRAERLLYMVQNNMPTYGPTVE